MPRYVFSTSILSSDMQINLIVSHGRLLLNFLEEFLFTAFLPRYIVKTDVIEFDRVEEVAEVAVALAEHESSWSSKLAEKNLKKI